MQCFGGLNSQPRHGAEVLLPVSRFLHQEGTTRGRRGELRWGPVASGRFRVAGGQLVARDAPFSAQFHDRPIQRLPVDELHRIVVYTPLDPDRENRHNVGVQELGRGLSFVLEAGNLPGVQHGCEGQHLESHASSQRQLPGFINHAHPAPADFSQQHEVAESLLAVRGRICRGSGPLRRAAKPGCYVVQLLQPVQVHRQRLGQVRMLLEQLLHIEWHAGFQRRQVFIQNIRQSLLLLCRQLPQGRWLDAQVGEVAGIHHPSIGS